MGRDPAVTCGLGAVVWARSSWARLASKATRLRLTGKELGCEDNMSSTLPPCIDDLSIGLMWGSASLLDGVASWCADQ